MDDDVRIGVYVCRCGQNIAGVVDIAKITEYVRGLNHVKVIRDFAYLCSSKGQESIKQDIKQLGINRVVIAACSPGLHERTFQNVLRESGLNPYLLQIANIREQCAWIHLTGQTATEKAIRLINGAVRRVAYHVAGEEQFIPVYPSVLVIGGGIAGIEAAINIANEHITVYLVEREPSIGGHMAQFDRTFPTLDCSSCMLTPKMSEVAQNPYIKMMTYSEVDSISGYVGNFTARIRRKARYVREDKCIGCGVCQEVCPITTPNEFDACLSMRKTIYTHFLQAVPNVPVIDKSHCDHFSDKKCNTCETFCEAHAIDFSQEDQYINLQIGAIIVATGYDVFDPTPISEFGYGRLPHVLTSLEFERLCSPSGPTGGVIRLANGHKPESVAIVHCVGSRGPHYNSYCSQVCCMDALKYSRFFKDKTGGDVYQIYVDMCCYGKGYEELYMQVKEEGVNFVRGRLTKVSSLPGPNRERLVVSCEDVLLPNSINITVDMVVLCVSLEPRRDADKLEKILNLTRSKDGFFSERHPMLDPVGTRFDGIFIVGCCQFPKDIPETVAQASAAASRALGMIIPGKLQIAAITASIDEKLCSGCKICNALCPYGAIIFDEVRKVAMINQVLCKGCNICGAICPSGAINTINYNSKQIMAEIEGLLE